MTRTSAPLPRVELPVDDARQAFICTMPMRLDEGWNQIQFNLSDFTRRAVRHELHRDAARADPRELPHPPHLLLGPLVLGGGAAAGVQVVFADPEGRGRRGAARRALIRGLMQRARSPLREGRRPPRAWSQPPPCARCAAAAPKIAPPRFFPPTALRRTVPPQQGGARVFLTTVLPYWFFLGRRRVGRREGPGRRTARVRTCRRRRYGHANAAAAAGPVSLAHASRSGRRAGQLAP